MRKKIVALVLAACMLVGGCANSKDVSSTDIDSVELASNQKIVIGKITEIAGNEITYTVAEEADTSSDNEADSKSSSAPKASSDSQDSDTAQDSGANSSISTDKDTNNQSNNSTESESSANNSQGSEMGTPPDMSQGGDMGTPPDMNAGTQGSTNSTGSTQSNASNKSGSSSNSSEKSGNKMKSDSSGNDKSSKTMYTLTDETATMTIPVGTSVITALGNKTTFSRLSNGDVIKMIIETDDDGNKVIVGVWMV